MISHIRSEAAKYVTFLLPESGLQNAATEEGLREGNEKPARESTPRNGDGYPLFPKAKNRGQTEAPFWMDDFGVWFRGQRRPDRPENHAFRSYQDSAMTHIPSI